MNPSPESKRGCGCAVAVTALSCSLILLVIYCIFFFPLFREPIVVEAFEVGPGGWTVVGDAQGESDQPTYQDEGGNPGPHMSATDNAVGGVWYWAAPSSFLETVSGSWEERGSPRTHLYFDLIQNDPSEPFEAKDVIFSGGDIEIYFNHESPPGTNWTTYTVPLRSDGEWLNVETDEPATPEQFETVLTHLDKLWIRGEFRTGDDIGSIDNIAIR